MHEERPGFWRLGSDSQVSRRYLTVKVNSTRGPFRYPMVYPAQFAFSGALLQCLQNFPLWRV